MAFQQYNSAAYKKKQAEYKKRLAVKIQGENNREDERQKKYGFLLEPPNVIPNYMDAPAKKGEGNLGKDKTRTGRIYTYESPNSNDGKMSPALRDVLHPPVIGDRIDSKTILLKPSAKKSNSRTAKKWARDRKNFTLKKRGGRRKRRKQRGGNTANCETAQLNYNDLANKIDKILEVKVPNWWHMNDGPYKLVEYDVEDIDAAEMGQPGIFGIGLESPNGAFFIPETDIRNETVRLCAPSVDNDTAPAGGRRKKRRKTRKNKRSKKRSGKKRKTRKRRKKRR